MKKRLLSALVALVLALGMAAPALAAALETKATYQGDKIVKILFNQDVEFKSPAVELIDEANKTYKAKVTKKGAQSLLISVPNIKSALKYKYKVSGVRVKGATEYGAVGNYFAIPDGTKPQILSVKYISGNKLSVKFMRKMEYKSAAIAVKNEKNEALGAKIVKKSARELVFSVPKAEKGAKYKVTISGVRVKGQKEYGAAESFFKIPPASRPTVKSIEYKEGYVIVEFNETIELKGAKASVKGSNGKKFSAAITKSDDTRIRFDVKKPVAGKNYAFSLTGIRVKGGMKYTNVSGKFATPAQA